MEKFYDTMSEKVRDSWTIKRSTRDIRYSIKDYNDLPFNVLKELDK